jgi:hypothetical protein
MQYKNYHIVLLPLITRLYIIGLYYMFVYIFAMYLLIGNSGRSEVFQKSMENSEDRHGGFRSHGGTPKNEWFISSKWMNWGYSHELGNL